MNTATLQFDPQRLLVLDQNRRSARALQRAATDDYQATRERRQDAQSRASMARQRAEECRGEAHYAGVEMAEKVEAEVAKLTDAMAAKQKEIDALGTAAGRANTLFRRCLAFAVEHGLDLPEELAEEAQQTKRGGLI